MRLSRLRERVGESWRGRAHCASLTCPTYRLPESGKNVLGTCSLPSAHKEGRYFSSRPVISPPPFLALERESLSYHPESPGIVKLREGRVWTLPRKGERNSSLMTTLPPAALTPLVVKDTKASLRRGQAERRAQGWFQDSFPCANLTSSTRSGLFSRAVFFFFKTWSGSRGQKYSAKPVCSGFSLAPWGFSQGNLTP